MKLDFKSTCLITAGAVLAVFLALVMVVSALTLMAGGHIGAWIGPVAFLLAAVICAALGSAQQRRSALYGILLALACLVLATAAVSAFIDFSYDGNTHHKEAVLFLAQGWNPLEQPVNTWWGFEELYPLGEVFPDESRITLWLDHYARGLWEYGAVLYGLTGWIEAGKSYTLVAMTAAALLLAGLLRAHAFRTWQTVLVALIATVNPITVPQMITYYNDGFMMMALLILLVALQALTADASARTRALWMIVFASAFICCVQTKFNGLAYAGLFSVAYLVVYLVLAARHALAWRRFIVLGLVMFVTLTFAVCVVGYSPYITNWLGWGNPFYPLAGEGAVDIMTSTSPAPYVGMSSLEKEFFALFSPVASPEAHDAYELVLKVPFSWSFSELRELPANDIRISGFGVLYSGIFLLGLAGTVWMLIATPRRWPRFFAGCVAFYACVIILAVIFTDSWWARYSCYRYFANMYVLAFLFMMMNANPTRPRPGFLRACAGIFAALLIVNTAFFVVMNTCVQYVRSAATYGQLVDIKEQVDAGAMLHVAGKTQELGPIFTMHDMGISYTYEPISPDAPEQTQGTVRHIWYWFG